MNLIQAIEIFAFVTGLLYVILEIGQKNAMWVVGILTGVACAWSFGVQRLWASMGLNIYYVFVSVWGLYQWRRDSRLLTSGGTADSSSEAAPKASIHLRKPSRKTVLVSLQIFVFGSLALIALLRLLNDQESAMDAIVTVLSAIGTWWLAKSYPQQWLIWIVADILSTILCLSVGMYWMALLYLAYAASAIYGWYHWTRRGAYLD
ncbi:MAG: nicotinamide mononucleotide transporter [Bacteroidales bacterium]|nr:nicotinamide mononucleotide transporter [Bacteroidales bacterium]